MDRHIPPWVLPTPVRGEESAALFVNEVLSETVNKDGTQQNIFIEGRATGGDAHASSRDPGLRPTRS
jgi:hypothetical protein